MAKKSEAVKKTAAKTTTENKDVQDTTLPTTETSKPEEILTEDVSKSETPISGETSEPEIKEALGDPVFVIPYLKKAAAGDELKYALRSIFYSFPNAHVVIIGDKEDYFSEEITHLQHNPETDNPQIDVAQKLILGMASGVVNGNFILTNDDIFLLGKTFLEDIQTLKSTGVLNRDIGKQGGVYNQNAINTLNALSEVESFNPKQKIYKYGTHTPAYLNATVLAIVIERYKADEIGHLLTTLYFNDLHPGARPTIVDGGKNDPILASIYRQSVPEDILENAISTRKFMNVNDDGYKLVEPYLKKIFPDKSKFEK